MRQTCKTMQKLNMRHDQLMNSLFFPDVTTASHTLRWISISTQIATLNEGCFAESKLMDTPKENLVFSTQMCCLP